MTSIYTLQGGTFGAGARQAINDAGAAAHQDAQALLLAVAAVDRVGVSEIVGRSTS